MNDDQNCSVILLLDFQVSKTLKNEIYHSFEQRNSQMDLVQLREREKWKVHLAGILATGFVAGAKLFIGDGLREGGLALALLPNGKDHFEQHVTGGTAVRCRPPPCQEQQWSVEEKYKIKQPSKLYLPVTEATWFSRAMFEGGRQMGQMKSVKTTLDFNFSRAMSFEYALRS